jgi:tRNA pseudouridine55 synthase
MTSHDVVDVVRTVTRQRKVGHAGTLDPDATGVLVLCLGRATRLVPYLQASRKTYEARMRLGVRTTTLDASGEVSDVADPSGIDEQAFCEALHAFVGEIEQVPPMVSAVKIGGERLYAKARRGEVVDRPARRVTVHELVLESFEPGSAAEATFLVSCSAGTYVRSLAADVGDKLGVGAHLVALRRLGSGRFSLDEALPLEEVSRLEPDELASRLIGLGDAVADYPTVVADEATRQAVGHGRPLPATGMAGPVAVRDADGGLIAMVEDREGMARPLAVFAPAGSGRD